MKCSRRVALPHLRVSASAAAVCSSCLSFHVLTATLVVAIAVAKHPAIDLSLSFREARLSRWQAPTACRSFGCLPVDRNQWQ